MRRTEMEGSPGRTPNDQCVVSSRHPSSPDAHTMTGTLNENESLARGAVRLSDRSAEA